MNRDRRGNRGIERLRRRRLLRAGAGAGGVFLAGCVGTGDDGSDDTNGDGGADSTTDEPGTRTESDGDDGTEGASAENERPVTGAAVPELEALDEAMLAYADEFDVGAGALGVARDGDLVFERGYGWGDPDRTEPVEPDAVFRIGSVSKLFTGEAVLRLIDSGDLSLDTEVYPLLEVEPPGGDLEDERFREVTVEHLLNHAGGWDRFEHANPLYDPLEVVEAFDLEEPPDEYDVTRYMMGRPLQFDPGTDEAYSNFGYVLLGQVLEAVTGESYQSHLERVLFEPAGVEDVQIGRTRPEDRHPDEVWYDDAERCASVFERDEAERYSCADHGFVLEAFDAAGGHVARTRSLLAALDEIEWLWVDGRAHESPAAIALFGSHPGSFAYVERRPDGVSLAALFNGRHPRVDPSTAIAGYVEEALDRVEAWP